MRYLRTRRGFRDFVRRNVKYGRAENLVLASDALEMLPGSGAFNPRIRAKAGVAPAAAPAAAPDAVVAPGVVPKRPDESARPMVPVGGGLGADLHLPVLRGEVRSKSVHSLVKPADEQGIDLTFRQVRIAA